MPHDSSFTTRDLPVIACDLDDVLSASNIAVAQWHDATYGTSLDTSANNLPGPLLPDFLYYYYWRNKGWGTPLETTHKVNDLYATTCLDDALPIKGALEGCLQLKELGFKLVVVTARQTRERERSSAWIKKHFAGVFADLICTGQSQETIFDHGESGKKRTKSDVCKEIGARLLIDDSAENGFSCATAGINTILFGNYSWNQRRAQLVEEELSYDEKCKKEGDREWWKDDEFQIPQKGLPLTRASNWDEIVAFVKSL